MISPVRDSPPGGDSLAPWEVPYYLLRMAEFHARSLLRDLLAPLGLSPVVYLALLHIWLGTGPTPSRLSAILSVSRSRISGVLRELERRGWIARGPNPADQRIERLWLTSEGQEVVARARQTVEASLLRALPVGPASDPLCPLLERWIERMTDQRRGLGSAPPSPPAAKTDASPAPDERTNDRTRKLH